MRLVHHMELPPDPFANDPDDPAKELAALDESPIPMSEDERAEVLEDLANLDYYRGLLEPRGIRGIAADCHDCEKPHFHEWDLLRASLEQLAGEGAVRPHEPAYAPNPEDYATWEYCRGYADAVEANEKAR